MTDSANKARKDFFISYTGADRQWAEWIAFQLKEAGYTVIIQAWDFHAGKNFVLEMHRAAQDTLAIVRAVEAVLGDIFKPGLPYKKAGVILGGLVPVSEAEQRQTSLFEPEPLQVQETSARLMQALDAVKSRYGQGTLRIADHRTGWKQRQEKLFPHYTTSWEEIIEIRVDS